MAKHETVNIEEELKSTCNELGIDYNNLKTKTKKHLLNIETAIAKRKSKYDELERELKDNKITLSCISDDTEISRQTLYNNGELKAYINLRMVQINELNPYHKIDELKKEINKLDKKLQLMVERDIDTEILRNENELLLEQIKNKDNTIARIKAQNIQMDTEITELRKGKVNSSSNKSSTKSKVITLAKDK